MLYSQFWKIVSSLRFSIFCEFLWNPYMALTYTQTYRIGQTRLTYNQQNNFHALLFIQIELWKNWEKSKTILQYQKVIQIYIKKGFIILRKLVSAFRPHQYTHDMKKLYEKMKLSMYYYKKEKKKVLLYIFTLYIPLS